MIIKDLHEIASIMGIKGVFHGQVSGFCVDSRKVEEDTLFFALKGEKTDGHHFLEDVAKKKAIAAVVSSEYEGPDFGLMLMRSENVLLGLQELARVAVKKKNFFVVAVTGSMGKTTTKEFISKLLETSFCLAKTSGNANSQIGLPLSLLHLSGEEEALVIEMAMSERHQIERLVSVIAPDIAVITKIGMAHLDTFSGLEGIAEAKAEIMSHPKTRLAIISSQAVSFKEISETGNCKKIIYGEEGKSDYWLKKKEGKFLIEGKEKSPEIDLTIHGDHIIENFLAAAIVARELGVSWEKIQKQAPQLKTHERRFEIFERNNILFVNDCYNANPTSMKCAFENIPVKPETRRKIAVIGEMTGLKEFSEGCHREIGKLGATIFDEAICMGKAAEVIIEEFKSAGKQAVFCQNLQEIICKMKEVVQEKDLVLIKGSNNNQLWKIFDENIF